MVSSSSSNVRPAENSLVSTGQRRVSGEEKVEALWRRAFDADTWGQYAASSIFEDSSERRKSARKYLVGHVFGRAPCPCRI
jgi:hypothetical protein